MTEQPQRGERDLNEFWWKIGSVAIAVMVWFIITTVAAMTNNPHQNSPRQMHHRSPTPN